MKSYTFTILLAVLYSVAADSHLPEDAGFVPPASPADAAGLLATDTAAFLQAVSNLSLPLPPLAKELGVEPSVSDSNNREFERHKYTFEQINRLCALLRDCNSAQYGSAPSNYNSVPTTNNYPAPPAPMPVMGYAAPTTPMPAMGYAAPTTPMPPMSYATPTTPMPAMGYSVPSAPAALPAPMPSMGYAPLPVPTAPMSVMGYAAPTTPMPAMSYTTPTTPMPAMGYAAPPATSSLPSPPAPMPAMGYASSAAPMSSIAAIQTPAAMVFSVPTTVGNSVFAQTSYNVPAQMPYSATTIRPVVLGNYYVPAPSATVTPSNYAATAPMVTTMRPLMQSYGAPQPVTMAPYPVTTMRPPTPYSYGAAQPAPMANPVTTMRPPTPMSYAAPSPSMTPSRPYPIRVSSGY